MGQYFEHELPKIMTKFMREKMSYSTEKFPNLSVVIGTEKYKLHTSLNMHLKKDNDVVDQFREMTSDQPACLLSVFAFYHLITDLNESTEIKTAHFRPAPKTTLPYARK